MGNGFPDIFPARDVSEKGIGIEVPYKFDGCDIDSPIELIITLTPNSCFKADGIIRHTDARLNSQGISGVELTSIQDVHENDIKHYIKKTTNAGMQRSFKRKSLYRQPVL